MDVIAETNDPFRSDELLTTAQVAARLRITVRQLQRMARAGCAPPHVRLPGRGMYRYPSGRLEAWITAGLR